MKVNGDSLEWMEIDGFCHKFPWLYPGKNRGKAGRKAWKCRSWEVAAVAMGFCLVADNSPR